MRIQRTALIPSLLADGHTVTSIDTQWFGNLLPEHKNLINLQMDVRDTDKIPMKDVDAIHLGTQMIQQ